MIQKISMHSIHAGSTPVSLRWFWSLFILLLAVALAPLTLSSPLPLGDYSNHLARLHILGTIGESASLSRYFEVRMELIPNLASDLLVPAAMRFLHIGVEAASVWFMAASLVLIATGSVVLNRVLFGQWSYLSLAVFLLLYNRHFLWGFMNYIFAIGVMVWALAGWIHVRERRHWAWRLAFSLPATALFFCHLFPLGVYGLCVAAYELGRLRWDRQTRTVLQRLADMALAGCQFIPSFLILLLASPVTKRAGDLWLGNPMDKLVGVFDVFNNYSLPLDVATWLLVLGLLVAGLLRKAVRIHPAMALPLGVLVLFYLALPNGLFSSAGADRRLTAAIGVLVAASLGGLQMPSARARLVGVVLLAVFAVRMGTVSWNWVKADAIYAQHIALIDKVDRNARVAFLMSAPPAPWLQNPPIDQIGNLVVVRKDAFVNSLFAEPGAQPVLPRYNTDTPYYKSASHVLRLMTPQEREHAVRQLPEDRFDWVYLVGTRYFAFELPDQWELVSKNEAIDAAIYRIRH